MAAKLVLFLIILAAVLCVATIMAYRYFDNQAEREHEKELRQMEQNEKLFED